MRPYVALSFFLFLLFLRVWAPVLFDKWPTGVPAEFNRKKGVWRICLPRCHENKRRAGVYKRWYHMACCVLWFMAFDSCAYYIRTSRVGLQGFFFFGVNVLATTAGDLRLFLLFSYASHLAEIMQIVRVLLGVFWRANVGPCRILLQNNPFFFCSRLFFFSFPNYE